MKNTVYKNVQDNIESNTSLMTAKNATISASKELQVIDTMVPGRDLNAYITAVNGIAVLTADEERELAHQYYYEDNLDAARKLVLAHLRFVVHMAKSYSGYGLSEADLIQEGNVGLMKAVKRFNPEFGVRLVSFAVHWIKAEMHEFILRKEVELVRQDGICDKLTRLARRHPLFFEVAFERPPGFTLLQRG